MLSATLPILALMALAIFALESQLETERSRLNSLLNFQQKKYSTSDWNDLFLSCEHIAKIDLRNTSQVKISYEIINGSDDLLVLNGNFIHPIRIRPRIFKYPFIQQKIYDGIPIILPSAELQLIEPNSRLNGSIKIKTEPLKDILRDKNSNISNYLLIFDFVQEGSSWSMRTDCMLHIKNN